jgi:hypothetical protein
MMAVRARDRAFIAGLWTLMDGVVDIVGAFRPGRRLSGNSGARRRTQPG